MSMAEGKRRTYCMFAIATLACALGSLTQTAMNSMLGGIQVSFGTDENVSQWLTTIFMLVIGITVPIVAHLSRRFTTRTLILASLTISLVGGFIGAFAPNFIVLLLSRIPQAVGAGITLPILQTIAMTRFPKGQNATAMGIAGIAMGFAPNIGPLIGGALVDSLGWRSFFWMYIGFCVMLMLATFALVSKQEREMSDAQLDFFSFVLSTLGFGGLLLSFSNAASMGFANPWVIVPILIGIVCLVWFVVRQMRIEHPLISMSIFKSATYRTSFIAQNLLFGSFMGITLIIPLFVVNVCGMTPIDAGMVFLPATVLAIIFNPLAGILSDKIGNRTVVVVASFFLVGGSVSMVFLNADSPLWLIMLLQSIRGIGVSSLIGPLNSWGMYKLPFQNMVDGSAFFTTTRQASASLCTAIMMMLVASVDGFALMGSGASMGYQLALGFSAALSVGVMVCAVFFVRDLKS